jgi:hypothetical protein
MAKLKASKPAAKPAPKSKPAPMREVSDAKAHQVAAKASKLLRGY